MQNYESVIQWLLEGEPAIRWQTLKYLKNVSMEIIEAERELVASSGWGAKLLALQDSSGLWSNQLYSPKWISTTYTMLLLRRLGLPAGHPQALKACSLLINKGFYHDGGINYFRSIDYGETCVTGMILSLLAYFRFEDSRIDKLIENLLNQQMKDGGWNCESYNGAIHSSFHTTISVLEGLHEAEKIETAYSREIQIAQEKGRKFLLLHKLYKSDKTGDIVKPVFTRFSFPPRWHYDILRALDYFQECGAEPDARMTDAIELILKKQRKDGRWLLQNRHPGRTFFELEQPGKCSRWNTLRALRVLKWWRKN